MTGPTRLDVFHSFKYGFSYTPLRNIFAHSLDAVNHQKQNNEVLVDTKISEKMNSLRDKIHGINQSIKYQIMKLKSDSQYK